MNNLPENIKKKLELMKTIILSNSGLLREYGYDQIDMRVGDVHYNQNKNEVYEIVFELTIKDVDCPECDFEPRTVGNVIQELVNKIVEGSKFGLTSDLQFKNSFNSTRGVLLYETNLWRDNFQYIVFGIFIDPGQKY
jgi:hypothetical protein